MFKFKITPKMRQTVLYKTALALLNPLVQMNNKRLTSRQRDIFLQHGEETLILVKQLLEKNNICFWLEFGTLLGAYRDKTFIKHDFDIDLGAMVKDADAIKRILTSNGFRLDHCFYSPNDKDILEHTYMRNGVQLDFFYFVRSEHQFYCHSFSWNIHSPIDENGNYICSPKRVDMPYSGFKKMPFLSSEYNVPVDTDATLRSNYGENYMIPDPNYDSKKVAKNITYYDINEKFAILQRF